MGEAGVSHLLTSLQDAITGFSIYKKKKKKDCDRKSHHGLNKFIQFCVESQS